LLNKYNVVDYHLILATEDFQPQTDPLTESDFAALWNVVSTTSFLGFFNGGPLSGASQPHKHLQLLPPPTSDAATGSSFEASFEQLISKVPASPGQIFKIPEFGFKHSCLFLDPTELQQENPSNYLCRTYQLLLQSQGLLNTKSGEKSYNFLMTQRWMMVVPRSNEKYGNISVNSIGFLGSMLVKTQQELEKLKESGPMTILQNVTFPDNKL